MLRSDEDDAPWAPVLPDEYPAKSATKTRFDVLGDRSQVPALTGEQAALILVSARLPREVRAAQQLLAGEDGTDRTVRRLNALGLRTRRDVYVSEEPDNRLPELMEERRRKLAEEALKEGLS